MEDFKEFDYFSTDVIHIGQEAEQWPARDLVPPISTSTTFIQRCPAEKDPYFYSRLKNPTRDCLEKCLASAEGGKHALCFASGMGATVTAAHLLKAGDHILCMDDVYGGTNKYFNECVPRFGIEVTFVDLSKITNVKNAIKQNTAMIWIETPTNPTMKLVDIGAVCHTVRLATQNWPMRPLVVVDNTFMSPYFQRPLSLGADIVMHSLSKYINGHNDVIMGALIVNDDNLFERLNFLQTYLGTIPSPFDCYLVNRGLKTLPVRMKEHMKNGLKIAKYLVQHPAVESVIHPGLPNHPQYDLGKKQMIGYSGMCAFYIKGGIKEAKIFLTALKTFSLAVSLGGFVSLAELPATQTHGPLTQEERENLGITDNLIRLSVGLENAEELIMDLEQAFCQAFNLDFKIPK